MPTRYHTYEGIDKYKTIHVYDRKRTMMMMIMTLSLERNRNINNINSTRNNNNSSTIILIVMITSIVVKVIGMIIIVFITISIVLVSLFLDVILCHSTLSLSFFSIIKFSCSLISSLASLTTDFSNKHVSCVRRMR